MTLGRRPPRITDLVDEVGEPDAQQQARADAVARRIADRAARAAG